MECEHLAIISSYTRPLYQIMAGSKQTSKTQEDEPSATPLIAETGRGIREEKEDERHWKQPVHPCPGAEHEAVKVNERSTTWL